MMTIEPNHQGARIMVASIPKRTALLPLIADAVSVETCIRETTADEQARTEIHGSSLDKAPNPRHSALLACTVLPYK